MSRAHRDVLPDDCRRCRDIHGVLVLERQGGGVDVRSRSAAAGMTVAEIGARVGLRDESVIRTHLAHLVAHGRLESDRRTPTAVPVGRGAERLPVDADPLMWAGAQGAPDRSCGRLLVGLARIGWSGTTATLPRTSGVSPRTTERHRTHLVDAELVEFSRVDERVADGRLVRRPDAFRLVVPVQLEPVAVPATPGRADRFDRAAAELLRQVPYLSGRESADPYALAEVARALREGLPSPVLLRLVTDNLPAVMRHPAGFLVSRVPASGARVLVSAAFAAQLQRRRPAPAPRPESPWDQRPGVVPNWRPEPEPVVLPLVDCPACSRPGRRAVGELCRGCAEAGLAAMAGVSVAAEVWVPDGRSPLLAPAF